MALSERERGFGGIHLGRMAFSFRPERQVMEGPAQLRLPDGRIVAVEATITLSRSAFSLWGEGCMQCAEEVAFTALASEDWLPLLFSGAAPVMISVSGARARNGLCHCRIEVQS